VTTKAELPADTAERIGAYRVVRRLATGGTSDVLLAKAEGPHGFERTVVLKVLLSHFGKDDEVA
jgi:serine/threonine-protein kinase